VKGRGKKGERKDKGKKRNGKENAQWRKKERKVRDR
jgi:hypothetical protein